MGGFKTPSMEDAGGALSTGAGIMNPAAAAYNGAKGMGYGSTGDILGKAAGMDPTHAAQSDFQATPMNSQFQATDPGLLNQQNFAQALGAVHENANLGFANGANGQNFAQGLMGNYNQSQAQQQNLINNLQQQSMGQGPGSQLAQNMMNQGANQNAANAMGLMASQKGINPAMAARMAGQQAAQGNQASAGQAANMGLQQQLAAQSQLGGLLGQNQALSGNMFNTMTGQQNQQYGTLVGANQTQNAQAAQNNLDMQRMNQLTQSQNAANAMGAQGINADVANSNVAAKSKMQGGIFSGVGQLGGTLATMAAHGGRVQGESNYNGDDVRNDKVHAILSPGEIVIPRSAAGDRDKAIAFIDALKSGNGAWKKGKKK